MNKQKKNPPADICTPEGFDLDTMSDPLEDAIALLSVMETILGVSPLNEANLVTLFHEIDGKLTALHAEYVRLSDSLYHSRKKAA